MLLQQIRTWTAIRSLHSRSRQRRGQAAENDANAITCTDATSVKLAMPSPQPCSITAITIIEDVNDSARASNLAGVCNLPPPDPQPSKRAKTQLLRYTSNDSTSMKTFNPHTPTHIAAASCLQHEDMWLPCELTEQLEIPEEAFLETNKHVFHNPHDMLGSVFSTPYAAKSLEDPSWVEERDKDVLREYFRDPTNIVLHSDCPHIAPHIVITPAEETPNDFYTPWNNRTLPQWSGFLMVPPYDLATGRLHSFGGHPVSEESGETAPPCHDDNTLVDEDSQDEDTVTVSSTSPKHVFCLSHFISFVERTANERLILYHVVKALRKHQCKAAAYAASARATEFCRRYQAPEFLASIERPFVWTDPAEPILLSTRHMLGAIVLESSCPFTVPHILINSPPPQNPWIPWHNAVNDPQDGRYLTVPSPRVNYINMDVGEGEEPEFKWSTSSAASSRFFLAGNEEEGDCIVEDADYEDEDDLEVDQSESPPPSRPGSPGPETPTDDSMSLRGFFTMRRPNFVIDEDDEDDRALALAIAKTAVEEYYHSASLLRVSLPVIEEEDSPDGEGFSPMHPSLQVVAMDEDEGLPPLDEWYLGASPRTLTPVIAVA